MALCSGTAFTTSFSAKMSSFVKPLAFSYSPSNVRTVRTFVTSAISSSSTTRAPRGIMKPRPVTPEMADLVGVSEISRTQALKRIWAHIKEHNLQDPNNKKVIICDQKLKKIFGNRDQVGFLEIAGLISPHFLK